MLWLGDFGLFLSCWLLGYEDLSGGGRGHESGAGAKVDFEFDLLARVAFGWHIYFKYL